MRIQPALASNNNISNQTPSISPIKQQMAAETRKLRIICLHGYLQNAEMFRQRIGSMRKALKSRAEFFFVDAPHTAEGLATSQDADDSSGSVSNGKTWWQWQDEAPGMRPSKAAAYSGWGASQLAIQAAIELHAPIDGILGFSQGATAAALYLATNANMRNRKNAEVDGDVSALTNPQLWAVLIGGFLPRDPGFSEVFTSAGPVAVPSLHVSGEKDEMVPPERSAELWGNFDEGLRRVYRHPGAHMVPTCSGEFKKEMVSFLEAIPRR